MNKIFFYLKHLIVYGSVFVFTATVTMELFLRMDTKDAPFFLRFMFLFILSIGGFVFAAKIMDIFDDEKQKN